MNEDQLALNASEEMEVEQKPSQSVNFLRRALVQIISKADDGYFILKERGRVIAEVGDKTGSLRAEINVLDPRCYRRVLLGGSAAAGEAFVEGWWTSPDVTQVARYFTRNIDMLDQWESRFGWLMRPFSYLRLLGRRNSSKQAKRNILAHYDLGNNLYRSFLDEQLQYSSALFTSPDESLSQAQINKLTRICDQLQLSKADHLLEVGSGWGGLAIFAAKKYGCKVTTTTISDEQFSYATAAIKAEGLETQIEILNKDYRLLEGQFDKIVSVEMIEAVGRKYLPGFFNKLNSLLKPNGLLMLQAITIADQRFDSYADNEDFIQKHVFPGGFLPSMNLLSELIASKTEFVIRDVIDIGKDYARTIAHWREGFLEKYSQLAQQGYDKKFKNLWLFYLGYCEGGFLERRISAVQLLVSKAPHQM